MAEPTRKHKTDADLRTLSLTEIDKHLRELDADYTAFQLPRWPRASEVVRLADERFRNGEHLSAKLQMFIRNMRMSAKQRDQEDQKRVQEIFANQLRLLRGEWPRAWMDGTFTIEDPLSQVFVQKFLHPRRRTIGPGEQKRKEELEYLRFQIEDKRLTESNDPTTSTVNNPATTTTTSTSLSSSSTYASGTAASGTATGTDVNVGTNVALSNSSTLPKRQPTEEMSDSSCSDSENSDSEDSDSSDDEDFEGFNSHYHGYPTSQQTSTL